MRTLVISQNGLQYVETQNIIVAKPEETSSCGCSSRKKPSQRAIQLKDGVVYVVVPDNQYVSILLRKVGSHTPLQQTHLDGVSIYTTHNFMVLLRYFSTSGGATSFLASQRSLPTDEKYIVSTKTITLVPSSHEKFSYGYGGDIIQSEVHSNKKEDTYNDLSIAYPSWYV